MDSTSNIDVVKYVGQETNYDQDGASFWEQKIKIVSKLKIMNLNSPLVFIKIAWKILPKQFLW